MAEINPADGGTKPPDGLFIKKIIKENTGEVDEWLKSIPPMAGLNRRTGFL